MVQQKDRVARGVGSQNFLYTPEWDEFIHIIRIHSPRAFQFISRHFPARTERSIRQAKQPKMSMELCDRSFTLAKSYLDSIGYEGPVAVACDDSKLFAGLRLHYDAEKGSNVLVGAVGGPILVPDAAAVTRVLHDESVVNGTKLRLWTLQVPLPQMLPVVVAALPIPESLRVPALLEMHKTVIYGLLDHDIHPISYGCDG
ncbi:hypothetical protein GGX14DRAFT_330575, partial [Mycena pura]